MHTCKIGFIILLLLLFFKYFVRLHQYSFQHFVHFTAIIWNLLHIVQKNMPSVQTDAAGFLIRLPDGTKHRQARSHIRKTESVISQQLSFLLSFYYMFLLLSPRFLFSLQSPRHLQRQKRFSSGWNDTSDDCSRYFSEISP